MLQYRVALTQFDALASTTSRICADRCAHSVAGDLQKYRPCFHPLFIDVRILPLPARTTVAVNANLLTGSANQHD
jgi:hypothetical protein